MQRQSTYVPARLDAEQPLLQVIEHSPVTIDTAPAWHAMAAATERTSSVDRAAGLLIRLLPLTGLQLVLSVFLAVAAGWAWPWGLVLWGCLASLTHVAAIWIDYAFSVNGLERHRIDRASQIQLARLGHDAALRRQALQAFAEALERRHG